MSNGTALANVEDQARFSPPRLAWHPEIEKRFGSLGVTKASWKALTEAVFPSAKSVDSVVMALSYCTARRLDPFKKPVHIVPMWDSTRGQMVETVWPGISEIRTTAFRTGQYVGSDEIEFGPVIEREFTGMVGRRGQQEQKTVRVTFPEWGRVNVYRTLNGQRCKFVSPKVYWLESYGRQGGSDLPNDMWQKRPYGQLEKCVEAAALRKAFPEEVGNDYTAEEMHGQALIAAPAAAPEPPAPPPEDEPEQPQRPADPPPAAGEGAQDAEFSEIKDDAPAAAPEHAPMAQEEPFDVEAWFSEVTDRFNDARTEADVDGVHAVFEDTLEVIGREDRQRYEDLHAKALDRVAATGQPEQAEVTGEPGPASDDEDDSIPQEQAPPSPGKAYLAGLERILVDKADDPGALLSAWEDTKEERKRLIKEGQISTEQRDRIRNKLVGAIEAAKAKAQEAPASAAATQQQASPVREMAALPAPEGDTIERYTADLQAALGAATTVQHVNTFWIGSTDRRNALKPDDGQMDTWRTSVQGKRDELNGLTK